MIIAWSSHCDMTPGTVGSCPTAPPRSRRRRSFNTTTTGRADNTARRHLDVRAAGRPRTRPATSISPPATAPGTAPPTSATASSSSVRRPAARLPVLDYFTPYDQGSLEIRATPIVASGGLVLLPPWLRVQHARAAGQARHDLSAEHRQPGQVLRQSHPACTGSDPQIVEEIQGASPGSGDRPPIGTAICIGPAPTIPSRRYSFNPNSSVPISTCPTSRARRSSPSPHPRPSISANGNTNGILWALGRQRRTTRPATAAASAAWDCMPTMRPIWHTCCTPAAQAANNRDSPGSAVKFETPSSRTARSRGHAKLPVGVWTS